MAWFHFCISNHHPSGHVVLKDQADLFSAGLKDLGHKVTFSKNHVETAAINLFWEHFSPKAVERMAALTIPYGIIATELPDGEGFNWRRELAWTQRYAGFMEVAKRAAFIWSAGESPLPFYSTLAPSAFVDFGFSERLIPAYLNQTPTYDFSFYGLPTPYREAAMEKFRRYASVNWPEKILSHKDIGDLLAGSKIGINFKQSEHWPVPSGTKLMRLLMAKRGIACEYVTTPTRQGEIAGICPPDQDFTEYALGLRDGYKARAEIAFERYRAELPMAEILERTIEQTVPVAKKAQAARFYNSKKIRIKPENHPDFLPYYLSPDIITAYHFARRVELKALPLGTKRRKFVKAMFYFVKNIKNVSYLVYLIRKIEVKILPLGTNRRKLVKKWFLVAKSAIVK